MSNFSSTELIFILKHKLLPCLQQRFLQVHGKMFTFTTDGIVVENIILYNFVYDSFSLFYFILFTHCDVI